MMTTAVLFDLDGTLVVSEETHQRSIDDVLRALGIQKPAAFDDRMMGLPLRATFEALQQQTTLALSYAQLSVAKHQAFFKRIHELHWRAGAREAMQAAQDGGHQTAIVTNSDRIVLDATLRALGISQPDLITVSRNDVRAGKPHPEPYQRAAWLLGRQAGDCVVVEDSHTGASAGLRAGMRVIGWPQAATGGMQFPEGVCIADSQALWPTLKNQLVCRPANNCTK